MLLEQDHTKQFFFLKYYNLDLFIGVSHEYGTGGVFDQRPYYRSALRTPLLSTKTMHN